MTTKKVHIDQGYHPGQEEVSRDPARFKVLAAGRRWGKTRLGVTECLNVANEGGRAWWVAPTHSVAMEGWVPLRIIGHDIPGAVVKEFDKDLRIPGGGLVQVRTAHIPQRLRGAGLDLVVIDEAAFLAKEAWTQALRPALSDRRGKAIFISTPLGYNWFYDLYTRAERDGWSRWQFPTVSNPYIDPEEIEDARLDLPSIEFAQEYEAEFIEAGGTVFKNDWLRYYTRDAHQVAWDDQHDTKTHDLRGGQRFCTVDLAVSTKETADYTVIASCVWAKPYLVVLEVDRARREGPDILPAVRRQMAKHSLDVAYIEAASFQLSVIQQARRDGMAVKELRADRDKLTRSLSLQARMESHHVLLPADADWLHDFERELLAFPQAAHDDQVDALSYAAIVAGQTFDAVPDIGGAWADDLAGKPY